MPDTENFNQNEASYDNMNNEISANLDTNSFQSTGNMQVKQADDDPNSHKYSIFFAKCPIDKTEEDLKAHFCKFGTIKEVKLVKDPMTKKFKGFGFIRYEEIDAVDKLQANRPHAIAGRELDTRRVFPVADQKKPEISSKTDRVYLGGIRDHQLTKEILSAYFIEKYGEPKEVTYVPPRTSQSPATPRNMSVGAKNGFSFVMYEDTDIIDRIVLDSPHVINNCTYTIKKGLKKTNLPFMAANNIAQTATMAGALPYSMPHAMHGAPNNAPNMSFPYHSQYQAQHPQAISPYYMPQNAQQHPQMFAGNPQMYQQQQNLQTAALYAQQQQQAKNATGAMTNPNQYAAASNMMPNAQMMQNYANMAASNQAASAAYPSYSPYGMKMPQGAASITSTPSTVNAASTNMQQHMNQASTAATNQQQPMSPLNSAAVMQKNSFNPYLNNYTQLPSHMKPPLPTGIPQAISNASTPNVNSTSVSMGAAQKTQGQMPVTQYFANAK